jgi:hypothetical protein
MVRALACSLVGLSTVVLLALPACSSTVPGFAGADGGSSGAGGSSSGIQSIAPLADDGGTEGGNKPAGCAAEATFVYVLSSDKGLYSFEPGSLAFRSIGKINCPSQGDTGPNSMAVDRNGIAWVNYQDGSLFRVDVRNAKCEATSYDKTQLGWNRMGMAFVSDNKGSEQETLFVNGLGVNNGGLGKIDTKTFRLARVSDFKGDLRGQEGELTGTGDARLYGFFQTSPAVLAEIDRGNGSTLERADLKGVSAGTAYAFSFWGGDFWFYTAGDGQNSKVTRYRTQSNTADVVVQNTGFRIVGAGVSTCAPLTSPN